MNTENCVCLLSLFGSLVDYFINMKYTLVFVRFPMIIRKAIGAHLQKETSNVCQWSTDHWQGISSMKIVLFPQILSKTKKTANP